MEIYDKNLALISAGSLDDVNYSSSRFPLDVVILDYKMPKLSGMEVARRILQSRPKQRILFASTCVKKTLKDLVRELNLIVELMQKPFDVNTLIKTIEDKEIWDGLD